MNGHRPAPPPCGMRTACVRAQSRPDGSRSMISCRRSGKRSITALISRTVRGAGRRCLISPSLPMNASMKPRGRSRWRSGLFDERSVSVITTTSRSNRSSARSLISRIWRSKAGSFGVSASTATMRHSHRKSSGSMPSASRMRKPSGSSSAFDAASSDGVLDPSSTSAGRGTASAPLSSCAIAGPPATSSNRTAATRASKAGLIGTVIEPPVVSDIGAFGAKTPAMRLILPRCCTRGADERGMTP